MEGLGGGFLKGRVAPKNGTTQRVMVWFGLCTTPQDAKEAHFCSAGVFTAPIALQLLTELFLENSNLDNLQKFISDNGQNIYKNLEFSPKEVV